MPWSTRGPYGHHEGHGVHGVLPHVVVVEVDRVGSTSPGRVLNSSSRLAHRRLLGLTTPLVGMAMLLMRWTPLPPMASGAGASSGGEVRTKQSCRGS